MKLFRNEATLRRFLWSIIISGSVLRFLACLDHNPLDFLASDPQRHWLHAEKFFHPQLMQLSDPIGYQVYLWFIRTLTGDSRFLIAASNGLLSIIMPWTFYRAGRVFGLTKNAALGIWATLAWTPSLFRIFEYIMPETLLLPLVGLAIWMTGRSLKHNNLSSWLIVVFCWTLTSLTKVTVLPLALTCLVWSWWHLKSQRFLGLIGGILLLGLLLLPNAVRTTQGLGFTAPLGNPWLTKIQHHSGARKIQLDAGKLGKYYFISPSCFDTPLSPYCSWRIRRASEKSVLTVKIDPAFGERSWQIAYDELSIGEKEWLLQWKENIILFFFGSSWPEGNIKWSGWFTYHSRWLFAPLFLLVIALNTRQFFQKKFYLIPVAVTICAFAFAIQNQVTMEGRYRKPLEALLILNLAFVLYSHNSKLKVIT